MMVLKKQSGTTDKGTPYSVVVARTSKSILPAKQTTFAAFVSSGAKQASKKRNQSPRSTLRGWIEQLIGSK